MLNGPLHIDALPTPGGGTLGLVHCPGRQGTDGRGRMWARRLEDDLDAIARWGAERVVSLLSLDELAHLGAAGLPEGVRARGLAWSHVPIPDFQPPGLASLAAWGVERAGVWQALRREGRVVVHCAAGLGRTGTLAAMLLVEGGVDPTQAIAQVRATRPGTIETAGQEAFVMGYRPGPTA